MLRGTISSKVDSKGRLLIGARFKDGLGDKAVVVKGNGPYLMVFPAGEFKRLEEQFLPLTDLGSELGARAFFNTKLQNYLANFFSSQAEVEVDDQGRISIPKFLCEEIGLVGDAVVRAAGSYLQVWTPKEYYRRQEDEIMLDPGEMSNLLEREAKRS